MPANDMPAVEVDIDAGLVRALLAEQFPDLAGLPLVELASGWDNVIFRLGDELTVRLPTRAIAAELVGHEQRWLPALAPSLPLPIPVPLRMGRPGAGYPWSWNVCAWLPGAIVEHAPPRDLVDAAETLGAFLAALHQPAPPDAPVNPFRGVPLAARSPLVYERIEQLRDMIDAPAALACWAELVDTPVWSGPPVWLHGDLHPANILVHEGCVSAVIDFGDITAGDPATDLALAWMMFPPDVRPVFRAAAGDADDNTWIRARGWGLALALAYLASSANNEVIAGIGARLLRAVISDVDHQA